MFPTSSFGLRLRKNAQTTKFRIRVLCFCPKFIHRAILSMQIGCSKKVLATFCSWTSQTDYNYPVRVGNSGMKTI